MTSLEGERESSVDLPLISLMPLLIIPVTSSESFTASSSLLISLFSNSHNSFPSNSSFSTLVSIQSESKEGKSCSHPTHISPRPFPPNILRAFLFNSQLSFHSTYSFFCPSISHHKIGFHSTHSHSSQLFLLSLSLYLLFLLFFVFFFLDI